MGSASPVEQWPRIALKDYFSIQYPPEWDAKELPVGILFSAPGGYGMALYVHTSDYGSVQSFSQKGCKLISSSTSSKGLIKNSYICGQGGVHLDEYISNNLIAYFLGTQDQIVKHHILSANVINSIQWSPGAFSKLLNQNRQLYLNGIGIGVNALTETANGFARDNANAMAHCSSKLGYSTTQMFC